MYHGEILEGLVPVRRAERVRYGGYSYREVLYRAD